MPQPSDDLDSLIARLERAVRDDDEPAKNAALQSIEAILQGLNPLLRGTSYAHVQSVLGRPTEAGDVIESLIELMPEAAMLHYQLGCYRREANDDAAALPAFVRATELDPSVVDAWVQQGSLLDAAGQPEQALVAYRQVILRAPTEIDAWRNLGNSLAALGSYDEALEAYGTAHRLRPDDETVGLLIASCHVARGQLEMANTKIPEGMQDAVGQFVEARLPVGAIEIDLRCRFHTTASEHGAREAAALTAMQMIAPSVVQSKSFPLTVTGGFVVRSGPMYLLCDEDSAAAGRPHRFRLGIGFTRLHSN